jgi:hypothetical protein
MSKRTRAVALVAIAAAILVAAAYSATPRLAVHSSLNGRKVLPLRLHWTARTSLPAGKVKAVDFLIDGRLGWREHNPPYNYGSDGNWLVTSFLHPGLHTFTVRILGRDGRRAHDSVRARVTAAPPPPAALGGTWQRNVTAGGRGTWKITIDRIGWQFQDPHGGGQNQDVSYPSSNSVLVRAAIEEPIYGRYKRGGAFCGHEPDPRGLYHYSVGSDGTSLTLTAAGNDCRRSLIEGTWTRRS